MNVRDCMKSPVFTVTPDTLIDNAMETMRERGNTIDTHTVDFMGASLSIVLHEGKGCHDN